MQIQTTHTTYNLKSKQLLVLLLVAFAGQCATLYHLATSGLTVRPLVWADNWIDEDALCRHKPILQRLQLPVTTCRTSHFFNLLSSRLYKLCYLSITFMVLDHRNTGPIYLHAVASTVKFTVLVTLIIVTVVGHTDCKILKISHTVFFKIWEKMIQQSTIFRTNSGIGLMLALGQHYTSIGSKNTKLDQN